MNAIVTPMGTVPPDIKDPPQEDLTPSDSQPPGVDEDDMPQSLEEALMGQIGMGAPQSRTPFSLALARTLYSKEKESDTFSRLDGGIDHITTE